MTARTTAIVLSVALFVGCTTGTPSSESTSTETESPSTTPSSVSESPESIAPDVGARDPHPDGRIVFGRITRMDELYGQVVALYAVDPDGTNLVQLTDGESAFPAWSPDGTRIAFTLGRPDGSWQIATMAPDASDMRVLTDGPGIHEGPSWSPDGSWIAYAYSPTLPDDPDFHTVIYRMNVDGSGQELLGEADTFDSEPRISPDGSLILFQRLSFTGDDATMVLVIRDLELGEERVVEAAGKAGNHANWSPDGQWIVYNIAAWITGRNSDEHLMRIAADGSGEPMAITDPTITDAAFKPSYSPDGGRIVFGCKGPQGDDALCLIDSDGSNFEIVVDEPGVDENHFSWGIAVDR